MDLADVFTERIGTVATFDDHVGAGTIADSDGVTWWFHATRIADGTRTIDAGAAVRFGVEPGPTGLEAVDIVPA